MNKKVFWMAGAAAMVTVFLGSAAIAQSPEEQVEHRQSQMKVLGQNIGTIAKFVRDGEGTAADVQAAASAMQPVAADIPALFPEGTGVGVSDSEALPLIWEDWDGFLAKAETANTQVAAMVTAAQGGDADTIKAQFPALGGSCGGCHETYRIEK